MFNSDDDDFHIHDCVFQKLYEELKEHRPQIEEVNRRGGKYIKEAKVSDLELTSVKIRRTCVLWGIDIKCLLGLSL